jgi:hypothetical protein
MRITGKDDNGKPVWWTTGDILAHLCKFGKLMNVGFNIFEAEKIRRASLEAVKEKRRYIGIEDSHYNLLLEDLGAMNFKETGLNGLAVVDDMKNVKAAIEKKPEDFDEPLELEWPLPIEAGIGLEDYPEEGQEAIRKKVGNAGIGLQSAQRVIGSGDSSKLITVKLKSGKQNA